MSNERIRRVRDVYNRFEAHRSGSNNIPPPSLITDDGYHMDVDHVVVGGGGGGGGRNRRYLMHHSAPPTAVPPSHIMPASHSQDMDQPADLSMKRESSSSAVGVDLSRGSSYHGSSTSSSRHHHSARSSGGWWRGSEMSEEGVLDLASRPPRTVAVPEIEEVKDENLNCNEVIVLSDEEAAAATSNANGGSTGPKVNGHHNGDISDDERIPHSLLSGVTGELKELSKEELEIRERLIMKLKENLRSEEMKLVLLKKLQLSHQMKENLVVNNQSTQNKVSSNNTNNISGSTHSSNNTIRGPPDIRSQGGVTATNTPPPLYRGQNNLLKSSGHHSSHHLIPPLVRPHNAHGPPPLLQNHRGSSSANTSSTSSHHVQMMQHQQQQQPTNLMRSHSNIMNRPPVTTPPNVVVGYQMPPTQTQVQMNAMSNVTASPSPLVSQQQQPSSMSLEQQSRGDGQTPAQRQAAAKLALRKQLEKTLLQIPPPKPPPPELHFIPNPSNTEFIYLVGLESVVNFITEGDHPHEDEAPKPFNCIQCNTDFTPVWKWENTKKGTVICEQCVTSNIKKALKAEHTNRLKTAFVKALQQEQEIEQRMAQVSSSPPTPPPSSVNTSSAPPPPPAPVLQLPKMSEPLRQAHVSAAAAVAASAAATHQQLLRLPLHQPLPAHMLAPLSPFLAQAYQYQVLGKNSVASSELQRQYLLDMIPPRSLSQQGPINWKT